MNNFKKILFLISVILVGVFLVTSFSNLLNPQTVRAFGSLLVNFHVPINTPVFNYPNLKPGDNISKIVDVTNNGSKKVKIAIRGVKTDGSAGNPKLENILSLIIKNGTTVLYGEGSPTGPKTLANFFSETSGTKDIKLNELNAGSNKTYTLLVTFPNSSGNEFQNRSVVFDLIFGIDSQKKLKIGHHFHKKHPGRDRDDEWIEIENPNDEDQSCNNWKIEDSKGHKYTIKDNSNIRNHSSALYFLNGNYWERRDQDKDVTKTESPNSNEDRWNKNKVSFILQDKEGFESDRHGWND